RLFVSKDGRTTFGVVWYRPGSNAFDTAGPALKAARAAAAKVTVDGAPVRITGIDALSSGDSGSSSGPSVVVEVLLGGLGALIVLFLRSIGYGGMLILLVSVLIAITLLPVILDAAGPRIDRVGFRRRTTSTGQGWVPWGRFVVRHRFLVGGVALAILAVFLIPVV